MDPAGFGLLPDDAGATHRHATGGLAVRSGVPLELPESAPLGPGETLVLDVRGGKRSSAIATTALLNVTHTSPTVSWWLAVYPGNSTRPLASSVNTAAGDDRSERRPREVGSDGTIRIYNAVGATHVIVDLMGWCLRCNA